MPPPFFLIAGRTERTQKMFIYSAHISNMQHIKKMELYSKKSSESCRNEYTQHNTSKPKDIAQRRFSERRATIIYEIEENE